MLNFLLDAGTEANGCNNAMIPMLIVLAVVVVGVMIVFPMITNRKQKKAVQEQRGNLSVGDTVETVGGIIGVIKEIREPAPGRKELVIESGVEGSKTTLVIDIQALYMVLNRVNAPVELTPVATGTSEEKIKLNENVEHSVDPFSNAETAEENVEPESAETAAAVEETVITPEGKVKGKSKKK